MLRGTLVRYAAMEYLNIIIKVLKGDICIANDFARLSNDFNDDRIWWLSRGQGVQVCDATYDAMKSGCGVNKIKKAAWYLYQEAALNLLVRLAIQI